MENWENIQLPWPDWTITAYLGGGGYGKVYQIERTVSGLQEEAALKIISRPADEQEIEAYYDNGYDAESMAATYTDELQRYVKEYQMMRELQGQSNIVSCDDFAVVPREDGIGGSIFIRMELLTPLPKAVKKEMLSEEQVIRLGKDICRALILCEERNIIHRDIKPDNILISESGVMKLSDFGLGAQLEHSCSKRNNVCGTSLYMAPEVYGEGAELKSDVWALGISIIEMAEGKNPFAGMTSEKIMSQVLNEPSPMLSASKWSSDLVDFVSRCLVKDAKKRASVVELLEAVLDEGYDD